MSHKAISLYIHWPFCKSKCPYCDFNSHVREAINPKQWEQAYLAELSYFLPPIQGRTVESVFFGGGTPSLMPPSIVEAILDKLAAICHLPKDTEVTLEANPTSVEAEKFRQFKQAGVNRLSLGIQSLDDKALHFLGREHNAAEALQAIRLARDTFSRYSFDLIYARPGQTPETWEAELKQALALAGGHLSLYQLTIEKGTPFYNAYRQAQFTLPDEEASAVLYELTEAMMDAEGMPAYEVSNYALPGQECRHNLVYWRYGEYLGIGPGAHSRLTMTEEKHALMAIHHPENWLKQITTKGHGLQSQQALTTQEMLEECLLMGLRLQEGVELAKLQSLYGIDKAIFTLNLALKPLIAEGLLTLTPTHLKTTPAGRLVLNSLVGKVVGEMVMLSESQT